jgi:two-component system OmpR family sensor kinase
MKLRPLSLRARLVLGVIVLAAVGLVAADFATYASLRSFLLDRVDNTLNASHQGVEAAVFGHGGPGPGLGNGNIQGDCVQVRTLEQRVVAQGCAPQLPDEQPAPAPRYPATISLPDAATQGGGDRVRFLTVAAVSGGERYRVRASIEGQAPNYILLIAAPLSGVDGTLHRLLLIEILVTAAALAGIAALGLWAVRVGLRPLRAIEATAAGIAAGDLTKRVERADERTEVGRLGLALNAMLGQIEAAFKAREASERKLRRFVADASHELRTPLAAVRAYAELFTRGAESRPEDLARSMRGIGRESERMTLLVEDLLLLARLDEGRPLGREPVHVDEVVRDAVETSRTLEPDRPIELRAEPLVVLGDRDRLRQIVDNLLSNVRAHTPPAAQVHVSARRVNGNAVIEVEDTGPGLSDEELERVFERFYRADASRSRASGGVGLGLSIVAAVVEAHGGHVGARSAPDSGAAFTIELPLAPE